MGGLRGAAVLALGAIPWALLAQSPTGPASEPEPASSGPRAVDSLVLGPAAAAPMDSIVAGPDSLIAARDSTRAIPDSTWAVDDSARFASDSTSAPVESLLAAPSRSERLFTIRADIPKPSIDADSVLAFRPARPDSESLAPDALLAERAATGMQLWGYSPEDFPTDDAFLYRMVERWNSRESLRAFAFLKPEVQAREDSAGYRFLPGTTPKSPGQPPDLVTVQVSPQIDDGTVEVARLYRDHPVGPRVRYSVDQYLARVTATKFHELWRRELAQGAKASAERGKAGKGAVVLTVPVALPKQLRGIFGDQPPNLLVRGSEQITFSGTSTWRPNQAQSDLTRGQSKFPQLDMIQDLNINLTGTIGDKVSVDVDQASQSTTPLANRIKIRYKGYADEILQEVHLGNTNLVVAGTEYVTFNNKVEGLFGINAQAKLGAVDLNMILSKQEGRSDAKDVRKSGAQRSIQINDLDYIHSKYFFLRSPDECPWELFDDSLVVFVDDRQLGNDVGDGAVYGLATANGDHVNVPPGEPLANTVYGGNFHILRFGEDEDYTIRRDRYTGHPVLELNRALADEDVLAVTYAGQLLDANLLPTGDLVRAGALPPPTVQDTLYLKMVRPGSTQVTTDLTIPPWNTVQDLELKNIYDLQGNNILSEGFELKIRFKQTQGGASDPDRLGGHTFLERLGLDLSRRSGTNETPGTDGLVDDQFIDYGSGVLYFPDLRPFDPDSSDLGEDPALCAGFTYARFATGTTKKKERSRRSGNVLPTSPDSAAYRAPKVYDFSKHVNPEADSNYYLEITYRSPVSNIQLDAYNIIPGSESVTAGGRLLRRDMDYRIDYDIGEVEILESAQVGETDEIRVTYSSLAAGGGQQKTLAGMSATYRPQDSKLNLATAWLFEGKGGVPGLQGKRPRLGEEPARTLVGELASSYKGEAWLLTRMADALPGVRARAPSRFDVDAGVGISLPNPNTRDKLYIDDFDGAKDVLSLGMSRRSWHFSSIPIGVAGANSLERTRKKGELWWYSPRTAVQERDLQPSLQEREGDDNRTVLELNHFPAGEHESDRDESWSGVVQQLSSRGADLSRAQFLDIWVNDFVPLDSLRAGRSVRRGRLHLDLGAVSEDVVWHRQDPDSLRLPKRRIVPPNARLDTEDRNRDDRLDQGTDLDEDVGLDGIANGFDGDDLRDNYDFDDDLREDDLRKYRSVNGTEDNQELDSEDLNGSGGLDVLNSYFEITVDLADTNLSLIDVVRDYPAYRQDLAPNNGWRRVRIPLSDQNLIRAVSESGIEPSWDKILHARLWIEGLNDTKKLQIGGIEITGNRWFEGPLADDRDRPLPDSALVEGEDFYVSVLNNKDDAAIYDPPFTPGKQNNLIEREQSITLEFANLPGGHRASIYRSYPQDQNYTLYDNMEFYLKSRVSDATDLTCAIRLCPDANSDTTNYYEYRAPVSTDWRLEKIDFGALSRLQLATPDSVSGLIVENLGDGRVISRKGSPTLTRVKRIAFLVTNAAGARLDRGSVWIDELRLTQVRKDPGLASRFSLQGSLSDFMPFSVNVRRQDADFLKVGAERGNGSTSTTWNAQATPNLDRFVEALRIRAPLRLAWTKSRTVPKFQTQSDLVLDRATNRDISESATRELSLSLSKEQSESRLVRYLLSPFNASGSYRHERTFLPKDRTTRAIKNGSIGWTLPLDEVGVWKLTKDGRWRAQLLPNALNASLTGGTSDEVRYSRTDVNKDFQLVSTPKPTTAALHLGATARPIQLLSYRLDSTRDLLLRANQLSLLGTNLGRETSRRHQLSANYDPPVLRAALAPHVGWNAGSNLTFLQSGGTQAGEPDRFNSFGNNHATTWSGRVSLRDLAKALRGVGKKEPDEGEGSTSPPAPTAPTGRGGLRGVSVGSLNLSYTRNTQTSFSKRKGDPSLLYQLGLVDDPGELRVFTGANRTLTRTKQLNLDTSIELPAAVRITTRFSKSISDERAVQTGSRSETTKWPELDINWGGFYKSLTKRFGMEKRIKSIQGTTRYSHEERITSSGGGRGDTRNESTSFSPLLNLNATLANQLTAALTSGTRSSVERRVGLSLSNTSSDSRDLGLTLKKTLTVVRKVQIPGSSTPKIVTTTMDVNAGLSWKSAKSVTRSANQIPTVNNNTMNWEFTSGVGYRFTGNIRGNAGLRFGQNTDRKNQSLTQRFTGISLSANFTF